MKKLMLGLVMVMAAQAQARIAAPVWSCKLKASNFQTRSSLELLLVRGESATGNGTIVCMDAVGQRVSKPVTVALTSGGVGPAFNGSLDGMTLFAVTAGLATPNSMMGRYELAAGPRLGLIQARAGIMAGAQVAGHGIGVSLEAVIENRFSIGVDFGTMALAIRPAGSIKTRY